MIPIISFAYDVSLQTVVIIFYVAINVIGLV